MGKHKKKKNKKSINWTDIGISAVIDHLIK